MEKMTQINRENNNVLYTANDKAAHPHLINTYGIAKYDEKAERWKFIPKGMIYTGNDKQELIPFKKMIRNPLADKLHPGEAYFVHYKNLSFPTSGM